ncbi:bifunctional nicotinamidase/pyrazinamidase [Mongoliitalea daihaiensis]|uniref:bifunctional nicotinamidase/pyrazinamidase n=1 Tax=Mongoliitalea daihaiensis TaxID=2782006 RepID=UPI001F204F87|nr:bifunctional nicotinamidase/pyrazinamidase [Mongoliitalea daihaiensis]UJP64359.1 bifunctional nicotinamidase/pyrazinamidase [Mongoliitalea daihaiensis]
MKALVIVDVQNDFIPGGALAVQEGNTIVPLINELQSKFEFIVATQDWHPADHGSFAANHEGKQVGEFVNLNGVQQILWPVHCVQGTAGAAFHPALETKLWKAIFQKGTNSLVDSYSGFFDNNRQGDTGLAFYLKEAGISELFVCGLATDYCVKFTVLDGLAEGFKVHLIADATRAVNLQVNDFDLALEEMKAAGATIVETKELRSL